MLALREVMSKHCGGVVQNGKNVGLFFFLAIPRGMRDLSSLTKD